MVPCDMWIRLSRRSPTKRYNHYFGITTLLAAAICLQNPIAGQTTGSRDLTDASLEDLMNIEVTSVAKKEQKLLKVAAAIYVISQDDIRRSGATNIPDLLRLVPGVDVARVDANSWAVSIRGFNRLFGSNKVLVLIDGRSVYTHTFSGVFWDQQDVPLENIERIEVIRGPGGTIWGANAVNGVINIITKSAKATRGGLVSVGTGSEQRAGASVQYGGAIGHTGDYRVFGKYFDIASSPLPNNTEGGDGSQGAHAGFRSDWNLSPRDTLMVEGDFLHSDEGETLTTLLSGALPMQETFKNRFTVNVGDALARWKHTLRNGSDISLQASYDVYHRTISGLPETVNTASVGFEHHLEVGTRNDVVWGLDYQVAHFYDGTGYAVTILPHHQTENLYSFFFQDEVKLTNALSLTLGSKIEHNPYTGFEYEPGAQLVWTPSPRQTVWASASQAIRQPSRSDFGVSVDLSAFSLPGGSFGVATLFGNPQTKTERLHDYEVGYRAQVGKRLALDVTAFLSYYHNLQTAEPQPPFFAATPGPPHLAMPLLFDYKARATNSGVEATATWKVTNRWKLIPSYTFLNMKVRRNATSLDTTIEQTPGLSPKNQFGVRSFVDLPHHLEWDQTIGYVGALPTAGVPAYTRIDTRFGWRIGESAELSVVGQNLLRPRHAEFFDTFGLDRTEVERSVSLKFTWRF
jgi:iron complex outermembrane receptor protein